MQPPTHFLPEPLDKDTYHLLRRGIADDSDLEVWVNERGDFTYLYPQPSVDYSSYVPRVKKLGLNSYKNKKKLLGERLAKIKSMIEGAQSLMEIGAADASFLECVRAELPEVELVAVEPDQNTRAKRDSLTWLTSFEDMHRAVQAGCRVDRVGLFHVFEHLSTPAVTLKGIRSVLSTDGILIVEVPCLLDPLLCVYQSDAYETFYYQRQHPYVYSCPSLCRVLEAHGFTITQMIPYQRYGLENHLQWLSAGQPGGNPEFESLFAEINGEYRDAFEQSGKTDTIIVAAQIAN